MQYCLAGLLGLVVGVSLWGQGVRAEIRPIWAPVLDAETRASKGVRDGQYIYFDPAIGSYVVRYVGTGGEVKMARLEFGNAATVSRKSLVAAGEGKSFVYRWRFRNEVGSRAEVRSFSFALPKADTTVSCQVGGKGLASLQPVAAPTSARQIDTGGPVTQLSLGDMRYLIVTRGEAGYLKPGAEAEEITCNSEWGPGWVSAYLPAGEQNQLPPDVPQEALEQLGKMLKPENYMTPTIVFGPKYPPGTPAAIVAMDLKAGLRAMKARGMVESGSVFVRLLEEQLRLIAEGPEAVVRVKLAPQGELEVEWAKVLRLVLARFFE